MSEPEFDRMTKAEVIDWFQSTDSLAPVFDSMTPGPAAPAAPEAPLMLVSIRLPVAMVERLDHLAEESGVRRSEVIRTALHEYVATRSTPIGRDEAEHALDVLRRIVRSHAPEGHADAA
ncbi:MULTISPECIES: ribbon-helix-helix domain-containing protein [Micromonospora]|uniref:Ribbon-helix-helix protein, copG family n=1 Tax=Micromonospora yangpuensis TaxID=683228 RepID=A0A1C6U1N0_9ACTN|nr:CopG family transcriptional regulator [Micromonospora yangpuensis]GGM10803.1 hypothetical protein GCM10012279_31050 [Micromonospora yangpuensis]SCL47980.1 Ribbon-helix-helix protein, copG family [Micromonospora yangpuensis]